MKKCKLMSTWKRKLMIFILASALGSLFCCLFTGFDEFYSNWVVILLIILFYYLVLFTGVNASFNKRHYR